MIRVLFSAPDSRWVQYENVLPQALRDAGVSAQVSRDLPPAEVDYIVFAPNPGLRDFTPYSNCKAVLSLWAGVETIVVNETLTQPLTRMVDSGLTQGMVEWVTGHVLRHHLGMDRHIMGQDGEWRDYVPPLAPDRKVTILGLGELGQACATTLATFGFNLHGWSRSPKTIAGVQCHSGPDGLKDALAAAEIVVVLLPLTAATENILGGAEFAAMARGCVIINPGRGPLIDDAALIAALDSGQLDHATLDVFRVEPLPRDHIFWAHPKVTVTPHIASETRPKTAAAQVAENIRRCEAGLPLMHLVDRGLGY